MTLLWKIGGEAGFGIMTAGGMFAKLACRAGYQALAYPEYPSLVRGGHNTFEVHFGKDVFSLKEKIDILVCLNKETYTLHQHRLSDNSLVIFDKEDFADLPKKGKAIEIPFKKFIREEKVGIMLVNNIALGASLSLLNWDFSLLEELIKKTFENKGEEIVKENLKLAKKGYDWISENYSFKKISFFPQKSCQKKLVLTGNDAFSLGAVVADCRLYCAYPMTPSSSVLHNLAEWSIETGMVVRHPEDEISAVNTAIGASFAGIRTAIGTSGGGFALMAESLSFAGIAEIPLVVFVAQRPGPATGMPTWSEQGDLLFSVFSGHGEFFKIVLACGDVEEMIELTLKAFDLADIYQTPVIVLSDKFLSESYFSLPKSKAEEIIFNYKPNRGKTIFFPSSSYLRYEDSFDGISSRLIPAVSGFFYQANSYEHLEDGTTTEEAKEREKQVEKRNRKIITYLKNHFQPPKVFGDVNAPLAFVSWGSNKGAILSAMKILEKEGISSCYYHFTHLYPLDEEKILPFFEKKKRFVLVENNSWGQFGRILRQTTGIDIKEKILKYNGRPFYPEEIISFFKKNG